jgi:hypothetical protein
VRENGTYKKNAPYKAGDVFRIAVASGVVRYYQNGTLLYTSATKPASPLLADTAFMNSNTTIGNARISVGQSTSQTLASTTPSPSATTGSTPSPSATTGTATPVTTGSAQNVAWTQLVNVTASGNSLKKTSGCNGCQDAGAISQQRISGDGYVEFTATDLNGQRILGLSYGNSDSRIADIDFGLQLWGNSLVEVRENGAYKKNALYKAGDVFRVAVASGVVRYYQNGTLLYTSTMKPASQLLVDTAFMNSNTTIGNARIFGN